MCKSLPIFLIVLLVAALPASALRPSALIDQSQSSAVQTDADRIDQIFKECTALMSKGLFEDLSRKSEEALLLSQKINDKGRQARALNYLGTVEYHRKRFEEAASAWKQSASLFGEANDKSKQLNALIFINVALKDSGLFEESLDTLKRALVLSREIGDRKTETGIQYNFGLVYVALGDLDRAESSFQEALKRARELKQTGMEFTLLCELADVEGDRGNYQTASRYFDQASSLDSPAIGEIRQKQLAESKTSLYIKMGEYQKALEFSQGLLDMASLAKVPGSAIFARSRIGWALHKLGRSSEGLESLAEAFSALKKSGYSPVDEIDLNLFIGSIHKDLRRYEEALVSYRKALATVERMRTGVIPTETSKASFASKYREPYLETADVLVGLGRQSEALEIAEAYHARAFLDLLAESKIDPRRDLAAPQRQREENLVDRIYSIQKELWNADLPKEREENLKRELTSAEDALEAFQLELRRTTPGYADIKYPELLKADRIQRELTDNGSSIVEYLLGDERSIAWVVTRDGITAAALPSRKEIETQIHDYRQLLTERVSPVTLDRAIERFESQSRLLYQSLFRPLESALRSVNRLIIIPDGALAYLPFETLLVDKSGSSEAAQEPQVLLDRFAISYAPSASALAAIKDRRKDSRPRKELIAFGDPVYYDDKNDGERTASSKAEIPGKSSYTERGLDFSRLPYTRAEVNSIGSLFSSAQRQVYLGKQASERTVKSAALGDYRYVHFAAHALIDEKRPARSGIALSPEIDSKEDGVLQMSEVMRLKLNADLVTLSACRTGLGRLHHGEGVIGLTRAFFYAGADSVLMSLWNANDAATSQLMTAFYQNLHRGLSKDESLRQAKRDLRSKQRKWRHPYYWAPFVLNGGRG